MTSKQSLRLERAEAVCRLVMIDHSCGLIAARRYSPDVVNALHYSQEAMEQRSNLKPGSLHWLGEAATEIKAATFAWMRAVGIDPATYEKQATQRTAMSLAQSIGPEFEGEVTQADKAELPWVERTADESASAIVQDFASGKIKTHEELRLAIAAEILEAEAGARAPFLAFSRTIFDSIDKNDGSDTQAKVVGEAVRQMLMAAGRWIFEGRQS